MPTEAGTLPAKVQEIRVKFRELLEKTNKDHPRPQDVAALADLLNSNSGLQLWRDVLSAAQYAERAVIENSSSVAGVKECWKHRLSSLRQELGYNDAPALEKLLIQDAALSSCALSETKMLIFLPNVLEMLPANAEASPETKAETKAETEQGD